ncbi:hypothetical protein IT568_09770 [bacterium]|nr:hypothetical protein [bacterium]
MSDQVVKTGGSIVFKIVILFLVAILIAVVTVPTNIWNDESEKKQLSRMQMDYLYQASQAFYSSAGTYATNQTELNTFLRDSLQVKNVLDSVLVTEDFIKTIEGYLTPKFIEHQVNASNSTLPGYLKDFIKDKKIETFTKMDTVIKHILLSYSNSGKNLTCPVTDNEYIFEIKENPRSFTVKSPINEPIQKTYSSFPLFSYSYENPGYIEDGEKHNWKD